MGQLRAPGKTTCRAGHQTVRRTLYVCMYFDTIPGAASHKRHGPRRSHASRCSMEMNERRVHIASFQAGACERARREASAAGQMGDYARMPEASGETAPCLSVTVRCCIEIAIYWRLLRHRRAGWEKHAMPLSEWRMELRPRLLGSGALDRPTVLPKQPWTPISFSRNGQRRAADNPVVRNGCCPWALAFHERRELCSAGPRPKAPIIPGGGAQFHSRGALEALLLQRASERYFPSKAPCPAR